MKRFSILILSIVSATASCEINGILKHYPKDEAIEIVTSKVPLHGNPYTCSEVVYANEFLENVSKKCSNIRPNSALNSANTLCFSWSMLKGDGSLGKHNESMKKAKTDFSGLYSKSTSNKAFCESLTDFNKDFTVE